jgi:hypothetical protein
MLEERLQAINELRKRALDNPEFIALAQQHERAIIHEAETRPQTKRRVRKNAKQKKLADAYSDSKLHDNPVADIY